MQNRHLCMSGEMRMIAKGKVFCMMLLLAALASGKTVTKNFAHITNVTILGPAEHTLVITNYYPSYTQHYTATWNVEYYDADVEVPDDDDDEEENEQENGGGGNTQATFQTTVEWSISGVGAAFAEASAPIICPQSFSVDSICCSKSIIGYFSFQNTTWRERMESIILRPTLRLFMPSWIEGFGRAVLPSRAALSSCISSR